jgi:phosphoglycerate-specific signal transduction histidine kinase
MQKSSKTQMTLETTRSRLIDLESMLANNAYDFGVLRQQSIKKDLKIRNLEKQVVELTTINENLLRRLRDRINGCIETRCNADGYIYVADC